MNGGMLQRYVAGQVLMGVGLTFSVIMVMIFLVDFVELSRDLNDNPSVSAPRIALLSLMRIPSLAETTLPFIFLFGAMWGMYRLNRRSELVVMRASGMSAWRFIAPGCALAFFGGVLAVTVLSPVASRLVDEFERQRAVLSSSNSGAEITLSQRALWLREGRQDGQIVLKAEQADAGVRTLREVTLFVYELDFEGRPEFARRYRAQEAQLRAGFWQLYDVQEFAPDVETQFHASLAIPTDIDPTALVNTDGAPQTLTIWRLPEQIRLLQENGFASSSYELRFHRLIALPLTLTAMTLVASAASLRLTRRGGAFQLAGLAALVGFGMYFGDEMLSALGSTQVLPLSLAAWSAPVFTCLAALFVISTLEEA